MHIANPLYDSVFKYLMQDSKIARLLITAITSEEIISLDPKPQEITIEKKRRSTVKKEEISYIKVFKLDYSAIIRLPSGEEKKVVIEIQKARLHTDIMRFRKYLGSQYSSDENVYMVEEPGVRYRKAMPIITIYFLGHRLSKITAPVIKVARQYMDVVNNVPINEKEEFVESLTHDSYVIQIPYLQEKRQTELLRLLSIFDQSNRTKNFHILNVREKDFPEKYRPVIRKLQKAVSDAEVRLKMEDEDRAFDEIGDLEKKIEYLEKRTEEQQKIIEEQKKQLTKNYNL